MHEIVPIGYSSYSFAPYPCLFSLQFYSNQIRYRLYGVIEHTGQLSSGHYAAYVAVSKSDEDNSNNNTCHNQTEPLMNRFIGPLNRSPKWPLSVQDLIQRLRRCDRYQLLSGCNNLMSSANLLSKPQNGIEANHINNTEMNGNSVYCGDNAKDSRLWYYCSDSRVTRVSESTVLNCQPYILFYERIE
ncbi:unnamed protein product [Trichobilharzia regenti]|nr:unnamed protein product [Trichobilharzia regenti]